MIFEQVIVHGETTPNAICIIDDQRELTYRQAVWAGHIMAGHIEKLAPPIDHGGDKIGLLLPPSAAFAVSLFGTRWLNRIALPLNYLLRPNELAEVVKDAGLKFILTIKHFQPLVEVLAPLGVKFVFMEDLDFPKPSLTTMAALAMGKPLKNYIRPYPQRQPDDVAVILYTSGTAGVPKGVMLTNRNLEADAMASVEHAKFTEKTVFLGVLPMFHTLGLMANCMIPMMLGCKVIYQARFSTAGVFEAVAKHGIEVLVAVPTMFAVLAHAKSGQKDSLKSLRYAISGGEPLSVSLIETFREKYGLTLMEGYGLTETSPIVALNVPWGHKPGSVGKVIPGVETRFVSEEGQDAPPHQDGELWLRAPIVMKGYFNKPAETAEVLTSEGWFKTGDIARLDEDGFLFITGRKKDMIIMAGEKVFPREIEEALKQHPAIHLAAVIGVKDSSRGEAPVAFVQLRPELAATEKPSAQDLRTFVRERIAAYKIPRDVYFLDDMPRTPTGKVLKRALKVPTEG